MRDTKATILVGYHRLMVTSHGGNFLASERKVKWKFSAAEDVVLVLLRSEKYVLKWNYYAKRVKSQKTAF